MVNPNELRKGNKVFFEGMLYTLKEIKEHDATFLETTAAVEYPDVDPVPLSSEILEACGFNIVGNLASKEFISKYEFGLREIVIAKTVVILNNKVQIECKHLHQLQNLIYFLSDGTELQIDEKIFRKTGTTIS